LSYVYLTYVRHLLYTYYTTIPIILLYQLPCHEIYTHTHTQEGTHEICKTMQGDAFAARCNAYLHRGDISLINKIKNIDLLFITNFLILSYKTKLYI